MNKFKEAFTIDEIESMASNLDTELRFSAENLKGRFIDLGINFILSPDRNQLILNIPASTGYDDPQEFIDDIESEKWIFHNLNITSKQVMLRYYCGLVCHFKLKNTKKALEHLGVSIFLMPSMPELWCAWGDILLDIKQYEKAKHIYKNANIVKKHRNIYDRFPLWIKKNEDYAENMYRLVSDTLQGIKIIKSVDNF